MNKANYGDKTTLRKGENRKNKIQAIGLDI